MRVIPVIDVRGGEVVHAVGGMREAYRPIVTPLAVGASPVAVARGLLDAAGGAHLYVADLDGIAGKVANLSALAALLSELPELMVWLDCGFSGAEQVRPWLTFERIVPVLGSETLPDLATLAAMARACGERAGRHRQPGASSGWVLSLDFKGDAFLGPPVLLEDPALWPADVVVMTLAAVGADAGPDLSRVRAIKQLAGSERRVFAAGGVRDVADLRALQAAGAAGVLVASALHSKRLKADDLREIAGL